jgi:hypothetical protein
MAHFDALRGRFLTHILSMLSSLFEEFFEGEETP